MHLRCMRDQYTNYGRNFKIMTEVKIMANAIKVRQNGHPNCTQLTIRVLKILLWYNDINTARCGRHFLWNSIFRSLAEEFF